MSKALRLRLADLGDERFEDLVYELVRARWPDAIRLGPPDGGADTLVPATSRRRSRVFQVKHYTAEIRASHWIKCRGSLQSARRAWSPGRITFVFPRHLTGPQLSRFRSELVEPNPDITVDHWGLRALERELARSPRVAEEFLGRDALSVAEQVIRSAKDAVRVSTIEDVVERHREIVDHLDGGDHFFQMQTVGGNRELPDPAWDPAPYLVFGTSGPGELETRVAAWPRQGAEVPLPVFGFTTEAARDEARRALINGREVTMTKGVRLHVPAPPRAFAQLLADWASANGERTAKVGDLVTVVPEQGGVTITPGPARQMELSVETRAGPRCCVVSVRMVPTRAGVAPDVISFAGRRGALIVELEVPPLGESPTAEWQVHLSVDLGSCARDNLEAIEFLCGWADSGTLSVRLDGGKGMGVPAGDFDPVAEFGPWRQVCGAVVALEDHFGCRLELPGEISADEAERALRLAELARGNRVVVRMDLRPGQAASVGRGEHPVTGVLFGQELPFGMAQWASRVVMRAPLAIEVEPVPVATFELQLVESFSANPPAQE